MSTSRLVYRGLSRIVHQFKKDQIPLRGVVGQPWKAPTPDNISYLQSVFRTSAAVQPQSFDDGTRALRQLHVQLDLLKIAEAPTLRALAVWARADRLHWDLPADQRCAHMLYLGARLLKPLEMLDVEGIAAESLLESATAGGACIQKLEALAEEVRRSAPARVFDAGAQPGGGVGGGGAAVREEQLRHISKVLFERHRYRQTPFEWVYDGLSPVLLADVLDSRKGLSIVLAIIYVLVGRDLGLALTMAPVPKAPPASSLAGTGVHCISTVAQAPAPADWMVYSPGSPFLRVNPLSKGAVSEVASEEPVHQANPAFHMVVWAELARIMMTAHQRRGESDDVAHWMYQLMALDPTASEWEIF